MERNRYQDQYDEVCLQIRRLTEKKERCWSMATKITPTLSDMPKGGEQENKVQAAVEKIAEIDKEIDSASEELVKIRTSAMLEGIVIKRRLK